MAQQCTLAEMLRQRAQDPEQGPRAAFIFRGASGARCELSWSRLYRLAGRWAALLRDRGLGQGQLVVNTLVNSPERVVSEAAVWMSGAASVNGQCLMSDGSDLLHTLRVSRASAVIIDPDVINSPWRVLSRYVSVAADNFSVTSCDALPCLKTVLFARRVEGGGGVEGKKGEEEGGYAKGESEVSPPGCVEGVEDFLGGLEARSDFFHADDIRPEDTLSVFTTSGSTGFSKLVVFTNSDVLNMKRNKQKRSPSDGGPGEEQVRILRTSPMGWLGGYVGLSVVEGSTCVAVDVREEGIPGDMPELIAKVLEEEHCTSAFMSPMYLFDVAQAMKNSREQSSSLHDPASTAAYKLQHMYLGGMPVTRAMVRAALSLARVAGVGYGATDFSYVSSIFVTDSETYKDFDTGRPFPCMSVKIVSGDDEGTELPVNQVGQILLKGAMKTPSYLAVDSEVGDVSSCTEDGYVRTGDVGCLDERGHLIVHGRGSDAIMRGAYIFYPTWMESCIRACPGVRDVIIVGIPDPRLHEELCACVVLESGSGSGSVTTLEQVRAYVEREVVSTEDDQLSPRPRHYLQFQEFPMTDSGKARRKAIKALAVERVRSNTA